MSFKEYVNEVEEVKAEDDNKAAIIDYFTKHQNPTDEDIKKLGEELGLEESKVEEMIYALLSTYIYLKKEDDKLEINKE